MVEGLRSGLTMNFSKYIGFRASIFVALLAVGCNVEYGGTSEDDLSNVPCTPTGPELCDGVDNDCDPSTEDGVDESELFTYCDADDSDTCASGIVECRAGALVCTEAPDHQDECPIGEDRPAPKLTERFPLEGRAAAAADVAFTFETPAGETQVECRTGQPGAVAELPWQSCTNVSSGLTSLTVGPHNDADSADASFDGPKETHIRFVGNDDWRTEPFVARYYVHASLHDAERCRLERPLGEYVEAAKPLLRSGDTGGDFRGADLHLANPFIQMRFHPPLDATYEVRDGDGEVEVMSLRRVFGLVSNAPDLLVVFRSYESRRSEKTQCNVATINKQVFGQSRNPRNRTFKNTCEVVVFNRRGAGVCLQGAGESVEVVYRGDRRFHSLADAFGFGVPSEYSCGTTCADNFMWRKLFKGVKSGRLKHFSPKCASREKCSRHELFLPGQSEFPDIF